MGRFFASMWGFPATKLHCRRSACVIPAVYKQNTISQRVDCSGTTVWSGRSRRALSERTADAGDSLMVGQMTIRSISSRLISWRFGYRVASSACSRGRQSLSRVPVSPGPRGRDAVAQRLLSFIVRLGDATWTAQDRGGRAVRGGQGPGPNPSLQQTGAACSLSGGHCPLGGPGC